jgi:hypothetical protein
MFNDYDHVIGDALVRGESPEEALDALTREPVCEECGHAVSAHGAKYGCEIERGDAWVDGESMGGWVAQGPCGCTAVTVEFEEGPRAIRV